MAAVMNSSLLISLRYWTNSSFICASCIPWIIITHASTPMRMKCPTVVASSTLGGLCHPTASVTGKVSSCSSSWFLLLSAASGLGSALVVVLCHPLLRSPPGSLLQPAPVCTPTVLEWQKTFEEKLTPLLSVRESLSEEEAQKMGRKDPEQEVEKFVTSNTQELGKDKWLCPLSGKKFKVCDYRVVLLG